MASVRDEQNMERRGTLKFEASPEPGLAVMTVPGSRAIQDSTHEVLGNVFRRLKL